MQSDGMQPSRMQPNRMQATLAAHEMALHKNMDLFLPRKGSNVYLLSGKKWRNIECGQIKEFKEIYYHFDLVLWDLSRVFDKINSESLAYTFPGTEIPSGIGIDSFSTLVLATIGTTLADNESLLIRYNRWSKSFCCYKFAADTPQTFRHLVANYAQLVYNAKLEAKNAAENAESTPIELMLNDADGIEYAKDEKKEGKVRCCIFKKKEKPVFDDSTCEASPHDRTANNHLSCEHTSSELHSFEHPSFERPSFGHPSFGHPSFGADNNFTSEQNYLIDRAIDAVERLQLTGLPMELIKRLISVETRFSRIVITEKFRIFLADYNNKEVVMGPLPKVIFLFFLKHDREFMFSDLMDYKQELLEIYEKVSNRGDKEKMLQSIETLVDPTNNSICEKCTAVRKAFLEQITYNVARNYFIDGRQGMPKKIHLDRGLVVWEAKI